jgi:hypothetical protein
MFNKKEWWQLEVRFIAKCHFLHLTLYKAGLYWPGLTVQLSRYKKSIKIILSGTAHNILYIWLYQDDVIVYL